MPVHVVLANIVYYSTLPSDIIHECWPIIYLTHNLTLFDSMAVFFSFLFSDIVHREEWLVVNLTNFFVAGVCSLFWSWPCTKHNYCFLPTKELINRNVLVTSFKHSVRAQKKKHCARLCTFQHKPSHPFLLLYAYVFRVSQKSLSINCCSEHNGGMTHLWTRFWEEPKLKGLCAELIWILSYKRVGSTHAKHKRLIIIIVKS